MALAFPKANVSILAPIGAAGLFWAWYGLTPWRAFWVGWFAGTLFMCITCSWIAETAGHFVAPFGFLIVLLPSAAEGLATGVAGVLAAMVLRYAPRTLAPLGVAAAFTLCEWLRSVGPLGAPFSDLSYTQVTSPLAPLAAFIGPFGLTFMICVLAAYLAFAIRAGWKRRTLRVVLTVYSVIAVLTAAAWLLWPARQVATPTYPVVAAQGNISQDIKWTQGAFDLSLDRYESLTEEAASYEPAFVLWPETVVPADLNTLPWLLHRLEHLAVSTRTELIVGSKQLRGGAEYNALYFFRPDGTLDAVYRKRLLLPFAEYLPAQGVLGHVPGADLVSRFGHGDTSGVVDVGGARVAPLICWESAFTDLALEGIRDGAQVLIIATDDAWFGTTAGPYEHAQIAQMRALETGLWVVRAGATGVSGIIAPNGRYTVETPLDVMTIAHGDIGPPQLTLYATIGSLPIVLALLLLYAALIAKPLLLAPR
ncbi:MAG TPA: apolipoprotein N-acyltransferase [Candidatus Acidoferrales bacterium]|nr:apolipoprotein N-acyltransferase [Candidatus Acidoferrales bacterium]